MKTNIKFNKERNIFVLYAFEGNVLRILWTILQARSVQAHDVKFFVNQTEIAGEWILKENKDLFSELIASSSDCSEMSKKYDFISFFKSENWAEHG